MYKHYNQSITKIKNLLILNLMLDKDEQEELDWIISSSLPYGLVIQGHLTTAEWYYAVSSLIRNYKSA